MKYNVCLVISILKNSSRLRVIIDTAFLRHHNLIRGIAVIVICCCLLFFVIVIVVVLSIIAVDIFFLSFINLLCIYVCTYVFYIFTVLKAFVDNAKNCKAVKSRRIHLLRKSFENLKLVKYFYTIIHKIVRMESIF